jgi:FdhD protein
MTKWPRGRAVSCQPPNKGAGVVAPVTPWPVRRVGRGDASATRAVPAEVPVAIVVHGSTLAVLMATPDDIGDFAVGFLLGEGVITSLSQVREREIVSHEGGIEARFWLTEDRAEMIAERRRAMVGPVGCGLCGIDSLDQAIRPLPVLPPAEWAMSVDVIAGAPDLLRGAQPLQDQTRAVHAAGFLTPEGDMVLTREDVGRHNALDKLLGAMALGGLDPTRGAVVMTSRLSVELIQKAAFSGVGMLISVSAPTAAALSAAEACGLSIVAHCRDGAFDIYTHPQRIQSEV